MRGYCVIGLDNPKSPVNVGSVMRAAGCYQAAGVYYSGKRYKKAKQFKTDPQKVHRHIPLINMGNLEDAIPFDCVPVAVDLIKGATSLIEYEHPERAFYIFGPEDGTLGKRITSFCRDTIYIPTNDCMNLAATVNVILYDRLAKQNLKLKEKL